MEPGVLIPAPSEDIVKELLALPGTILPVTLESLTLFDVSPEFLDQIGRQGPSMAGRGIFQRFVAALPDCAALTIETYEKPFEDTLEVLDMIADSLDEMNVAFEVSWGAPYSDDHEHLI